MTERVSRPVPERGKITQIYEGTTEIQKKIIARELQGEGLL